MMRGSDFFIIFSLTVLCTLLSRTLPVFLFARRAVPPALNATLDYIPIAAFAALVTNDLFQPHAFASGAWPALLPYVALIPVLVVARMTRSLGLCTVTGVLAFGVLQWLS
ncbi:MAG: AzlD domain-containing protein [Zoogloeaceae bacterium]|jgi:branched-subunit amino acid transport protein|nr:AzlD domain-containing protein [Zoogloeaceae bacterium]